MCNRDERGPAELHYQSSICPHPYYKFHVDEREKTLQPSILFFHILGFESGRGFSEELRHRVVSKVREYEVISKRISLVISKRITTGVQAKKRYSPALLWGSSKH